MPAATVVRQRAGPHGAAQAGGLEFAPRLFALLRSPAAGYAAGIVGVAVVTAVCAPFHEHLNNTTVALALLLVVLFVATGWGSWPAFGASVVGMLCFNFFFLPPIYTLTIADPQNWVALSAFFVTSITVGQLSARATRRAAEAEAGRDALTRAEERYRGIFENAAEGIYQSTPEGRYLAANPAFAQMLGYSSERDLLASIQDIARQLYVDPGRRAALRRLLDEHGVVRNFEAELRRKDGSTLWGMMTLRAVRNGGGACVYEGFIIDVTGRRRADRAQRALSKCNEALIRATDEAALLNEICRVVVENAGYRFCWVGRAEHDERRSVKPVAHAGSDEGYLETLDVTWADELRGQGPTGTAIRTRRAVTAKNIATDPGMAPWREQAVKRGFASSIAIPLIVEEAFGAIMIYSREADAFDTEEVKLLTELADDLAFGIGTLRTRIERDRAAQELRELNADLEWRVVVRTRELETANTLKDDLILRERAANDALATAREREAGIGFRIQSSLLLDQPPRNIPGLRVAALSVPSEGIDGDFYIFVNQQGRVLDVVVGDVMGKGIPAALLGAAAKSHFLRALGDLASTSGKDELLRPREVVMMAHASLARTLIELESFMTVCYARIDATRRRLEFVDCGHTGIVHVSARTAACVVLHGDNLPLGVREGEIYEEISVPLEPGDGLLFYSDGITEARSPAGELFGVERLEACVREHSTSDAAALVEAIRVAVLSFCAGRRLSDDLTCVAVRMEESLLPLARDELDLASDLGELRRARAFVRTFCASLPGEPMDETRVAELELAVDEALSNIVKHAYAGRADQWIHMETEAFHDVVTIRLHHLGDPFVPSMARPPALDGSRESGFGAYLITRSVDEARYYRDERGNCVALVKARKPWHEG